VALAMSSFSQGLYHLIHSKRIALRIALRVTVGVMVVKTEEGGVEWMDSSS